MKIEKRSAVAVGITAVVVAVVLLAGMGRARAANAPDRYLHVRVDGAADGEKVSVNVPLALAEKVLPAINHGELHGGKVKIGNMNTGDVDVRAILDAVRSSPDNEFVTVQQADQDVRVAKVGDNLVVHVRSKDADGKENKAEKVDVTVPLSIVDAVLKNNTNSEIDLTAVLRALQNSGESFVVNVQNAEQTVRVWVDGKNDSN